MTNFDVILIGASVRSMAESAIRDGLRPFCLDMFGDSDLLRLLAERHQTEVGYRKIASFSDVINQLAAVSDETPVVAFGGVENHPGVIDQLRERFTVVGTDPATIAELRDPGVFFSALQAAGIFVPNWRAASGKLTSGWIRKSTRSSGGLGISFHGDPVNEEGCTYDQQLVTGISASATFYRNLTPGRHLGEGSLSPQDTKHSTAGPSATLVGVALQLSGLQALGARGFHYCGNAGPVQPNDSLLRRIQAAGNAIAERWELRGLFGVDFVVKNNEPIVLEVNPRLTASHELHEWANPERPGHLQLQLSGVSPFPSGLERRIRGQWARFVLYADKEFVFNSKTHEYLMSQTKSVGNPGSTRKLWLADISEPGTVVPQGAPVFSVYINLRDRPKMTGDPHFDRYFAGFGSRYGQLVDSVQSQVRKLESDYEIANS